MEKVSIDSIGCCGSVCGTCKVKKENKCIGCKNGYKNNERVLSKAKCKIKICCISNDYETCADCKQLNNCILLKEFYGKSGYKYKKYEEAIKYILKNGYKSFLQQCLKWTMQYGKYE